MDKVSKNITLIISNIFFGLLLYFFTTIPEYQGNEESCIKLIKYAHMWGTFALIMAVIYGLLFGFYFRVMLITFCLQIKQYQLLNYQEPIQLIDAIITTVFLFLVMTVIDREKDCGSLIILILAIITIFIICIIIQCIVICIVMKCINNDS